MFHHWRLLAPALLVIGGCASLRDAPRDAGLALPYVTSFAAGRHGTAGGPGWQEWSFSRFKRPTRYELIEDSGALVIKASADGSASGLRHAVKVDPASYPVLTWRWKVNELIESADNTRKHTEDSPVRVLVTFDGTIEKIPFPDRVLFDNVYLLTGRRMPYATLVYIWENRVPKNTVIPNLHTSRIKMLVAESGRKNVGRWQRITRHIMDDYRSAFGEEPGMITSVGIMTDTDNTGLKADAFYGDIELRRAP